MRPADTDGVGAEAAAPLLLVAGQSARALSAAARRAGFRPLAVDLFGDDDTLALSAGNARIAALTADAVARALTRLIEKHSGTVSGLVLGSGFEHRPRAVSALSARFGLLGNPADVVARANDPFALAALCRAAGVPHPEVRRPADMDTAPADTWLLKRRAGTGGAHVRAWHAGAPTRGCYAQRRVAGQPVSACFMADGRRTAVLGFTAQWSDPSDDATFRYGGAVRPAAARFEPGMTLAVARLAQSLGLVGLNSADFLVAADGFHLVEINPRPGATLDLFADALPMRLHVEACRDATLPEAPPVLPGASASALAYAGRDGHLPRGFAWPDWAADRQRHGRVRAGAPLCTALAEADRPAAARRLARTRAASLLDRAGLLPARPHGPGLPHSLEANAA
ncbi:MAG: ATP-grasp domain-containing protein [Janthinobacterium lividum]